MAYNVAVKARKSTLTFGGLVWKVNVALCGSVLLPNELKFSVNSNFRPIELQESFPVLSVLSSHPQSLLHHMKSWGQLHRDVANTAIK